MKVLESKFKSSVLETIILPQGKVFIFSNFIITEFDESITVDLECFLALLEILEAQDNDKTQFGFISNRLNSYTLEAEDFLSIATMSSKKYKSAVVVHNERIARTTSFEQHIFKCNTSIFCDLEKAVSWINSTDSLGVAS